MILYDLMVIIKLFFDINRERKHTCPTCSKGFTSNFKLMEHIRVHTKIYVSINYLLYKVYNLQFYVLLFFNFIALQM